MPPRPAPQAALDVVPRTADALPPWSHRWLLGRRVRPPFWIAAPAGQPAARRRLSHWLRGRRAQPQSAAAPLAPTETGAASIRRRAAGSRGDGRDLNLSPDRPGGLTDCGAPHGCLQPPLGKTARLAAVLQPSALLRSWPAPPNSARDFAFRSERVRVSRSAAIVPVQRPCVRLAALIATSPSHALPILARSSQSARDGVERNAAIVPELHPGSNGDGRSVSPPPAAPLAPEETGTVCRCEPPAVPLSRSSRRAY